MLDLILFFVCILYLFVKKRLQLIAAVRGGKLNPLELKHSILPSSDATSHVFKPSIPSVPAMSAGAACTISSHPRSLGSSSFHLDSIQCRHPPTISPWCKQHSPQPSSWIAVCLLAMLPLSIFGGVATIMRHQASLRRSKYSSKGGGGVSMQSSSLPSSSR